MRTDFKNQEEERLMGQDPVKGGKGVEGRECRGFQVRTPAQALGDFPLCLSLSLKYRMTYRVQPKRKSMYEAISW